MLRIVFINRMKCGLCKLGTSCLGQLRWLGQQGQLEQLGRLERAASAPALLQAGAVRTAGPGFDPLPAVRTGGGLGPTGSAGEAWRGGGGLEGYAAPEEELRWAERADRAFRRDSRRYDGGFYLF